MLRQMLQRRATEFNEGDILSNLMLEKQQHRVSGQIMTVNRKLDQVDYWRKQSGWYDDDVTMAEYNSGIYSTDDFLDDYLGQTNSEEGSEGFSIDPAMLMTGGKIAGALVGIAVLVMLVRAIARGAETSQKEEKSDRPKSRSKRSTRRERSPSRSRSKSRTRTSRSRGGSGDTDDHYELMEEKESKTKSSKSRSSRTRSRSKSRSRPSSSRKRSHSRPRSRSRPKSSSSRSRSRARNKSKSRSAPSIEATSSSHSRKEMLV